MKIVILTFFVFTQIVQAQNLDSLYNELLNLKSKKQNVNQTVVIENKISNKCGFGLIATVKENFNRFDYEQQQTIQEILERPSLQTSIVSPSGIFRIHFDNSGVNQPSYDINDLAIAFDSAYNYETNVLGYLPPPNDGTLGGDDKYDVYVLNLGGGLYGATTPEVYLDKKTYQSYIEMDNSFSKTEGYNTFGINAARVTAAHEFHHAIQVGSYTYNTDDLYYYELTSTSMEEFVYDEVNDYYAYMPSFFNTLGSEFDNHDGYDLAVWNIFLRERMGGVVPNDGDKIIKRSWELMRDKEYRATLAIANALNEYGYSFAQEFNVFADWLYFSGENSKNGEFFEESSHYPSVKPTITTQLNEPQKTVMFVSEPTSINYLRFIDLSQGLPDTIFAVLTNSDVDGSLSGSNNSVNVDFTISTSPFSGSYSINDYYFSKISGSSTGFINQSYIINNELSAGAINRTEVEFAYPQPFNYSENNLISIPTNTDVSGKSELYIYSSDMNLVYSSTKIISNSGNLVVTWDGKDENGNKLASGVYLYVTNANDKIKKGKIVILN